MPAKGAAIMSQIEGLVEQLLELDYDTPAKDWANQVLPDVRSQLEELRAEAGVDSPDGELPEGEDTPMGPMGQGALGEVAEPMPDAEQPEESLMDTLRPAEQPRDLKSATDMAAADLKERGGFGDRPKADEEQDDKKKKRPAKAKAYSG